MRRLLSVLAAAAVVAAPTVNAATCARQNVPGATLLVPYFRVFGRPNDCQSA